MNADTTSLSPIQRQIVNANVGTTNIIESADIATTMMATFDEISSILKDHAGPYSRFAIITDPLNPLAEPVFTKDGINIVRAIEFISPMQAFIKRMVEYIGVRIEAAAGDGTTSAMIIATGVLNEIVKAFKLNNVKLSYKDLVRLYQEFVTEIDNFYKPYIYTLSTANRTTVNGVDPIVYRIAYAQAYTSSHGDQEIAEAVATMFANASEKAWNYVTFERSRFETDQRITVEIEESDFVSECEIYNRNMLNADLNTNYRRSDVKLLLVNSNVVEGNSYIYEKVMKEVNAALENKTALAIYMPSGMDQITRSKLDTLFLKYPDHQVAMFLYVPEFESKITDLVILSLLAGKDPMLAENKIITLAGVDLEFASRCLKLTSLYKDGKNGIAKRPTEDDRDYPFFGEYINHIRMVIDGLRAQKATHDTHRIINLLQRNHNRLFLSRQITVRIGGNSHDNAAAMDVVTDAVSAVRCALTKGFTFTNNRALYFAIEDYLNAPCDASCEKPSDTKVKNIFGEAFLNAIDQARVATGTHAASPPEFYEKTKSGIAGLVPKKRVVSNDLLTNEIYFVDEFSEYFIKPDTGLDTARYIIQPATIDMTILKRFGEVALRFIQTERVIIPHGVYLKEANKPESEKATE